MGEVGIDLDSNSTRWRKTDFEACEKVHSLKSVSATATSLSSSSAALLAKAREMYLRNAGPVDSSILSTFDFLCGYAFRN